jgi:hypothetical protein
MNIIRPDPIGWPLLVVINMRNKSKIPELCLILRTDSLFSGSDLQYWQETYEIREGFIMVLAKFWGGAAGIEGQLSLCIPPKNHDVDSWEGSCEAGHWDCWEFLNLMTIPNLDSNRWENGVSLLIFYGNNTYFDSPLEVVKSIKITADESSELTNNSAGPKDQESISEAIKALLPILNRELGAEVCEQPKPWWTEI